MLVTIVYDETDAVKMWINNLRQTIRTVSPTVTFKTGPIWDFTDSVFETKGVVLVILSKKGLGFCDNIHQSLVKRRSSAVSKHCRVCVVIESKADNTKAKLEDLTGMLDKDNVAVVEDLADSFRWLPKICTVILKLRKSVLASTCVIVSAVSDTKIEMLRKSLVAGLKDISVNVSEEFMNDISDCCIIFRKNVDDSLDASVQDNVDAMKR